MLRFELSPEALQPILKDEDDSEDESFLSSSRGRVSFFGASGLEAALEQLVAGDGAAVRVPHRSRRLLS